MKSRYRKAATAAALCLSMLTAAGVAAAHDITGWVSPSGTDFVEDLVPTLVPNPLPVPDITKKVFSCVGDDTYATQFDTTAVLTIHDTEISSPAAGQLRLDVLFSLQGDGQLRVEGTCVPDGTCDDFARIDNARVIIDFAVGSDHGRPQVTVLNVEMKATEDDVVINFANCGFGDEIANAVVGFAKEWFLGFIVNKIEDLAEDKMRPMIEDMVAGFSSFEGSLLVIDYQAQLMSIDAGEGGITIGAEADISSDHSASACIAEDPGDPAPHPGDAPDLAEGDAADIGVAVNLGLLNDVLYHVWRAGLLCLTDQTLQVFGIELPLDHFAGAMLPGFPPGTDFSLAIHMSSPPRVVGLADDAAAITLVAEGLTVDLTGRTQSGFEGTLHVEADIEATAEIGLDPGTGAITAQVRGVDITRFEIDDQVGATELGFDVAGIHHKLEEVLLPKILGELGAVPLTGSIFGFGNVYLLLREARTTASHLVAKADLFAAPQDDVNPPETAIASRPEGWVSPANARLLLTGTDPELPGELLRYRVIVDNVARDPSFVREVSIGAAGVSQTYQVTVSAMDLAGNEDPTPLSLEVMVDGIAPRATIVGDRVRDVTAGLATVEWTLSDDITPAAEIVPTVRVFRVNDHTDATDVTLVAESELRPGATSAAFEVEAGELYRVELTARDKAGNEWLTSALVSAKSEASAGGCAVARPGQGAAKTGLWALLPLLALAVALGRVRRRA